MRVSEQVLSILSDADVSGNSLVLQGQLDRNTYTAVNKVLEAAGWKWNRKAKAHTCDGEAVTVLDQVLLTGQVVVAKQEFDEFESTDPVIEQLIELAQIPDQDGLPLERRLRVLEPSAGPGRIVKALRAEGVIVFANDIQEKNVKRVSEMLYPEGSCRHGDFLAWDPEPVFDRVVMNPPFSRQQDIKHVTHAFRFLRPGGRLVSVMSAGVRFRTNRLTNEFRALVDASGGEIAPLPEGSFKDSGTMVNTIIATLNA